MPRYNQNSGYGQALINMVASQVPTFGRIFVVFNSSNTDEQNYQMAQEVCKSDPEGKLRFYTSLSDAYDATESNNNDVILLDANSSHTLSAGLAITKNRVHFVGMDGGGRYLQQGAKVQTTGNPSTAYLIKDTGTRNTFRNIKFIQNSTDAAAITCAQMGGEGTYVENCSFTFGTATNIDGTETTSYEIVLGTDSATFRECLFGTSTLVGDGARAVMAISRVNGTQELKDNVLKDCIWSISSESASADMIRVTNTNAAKFNNVFINPIFQAVINSSLSAITLDDAVRSVSGLVEGELLFVNPSSNCTEFCSDVTDLVKVIGWGLDGTNPAQKIGIGLTPA